MNALLGILLAISFLIILLTDAQDEIYFEEEDEDNGTERHSSNDAE